MLLILSGILHIQNKEKGKTKVNFYSELQKEKEERQKEQFMNEKKRKFQKNFPQQYWEFFKSLRIKKQIPPSTWNCILDIRFHHLDRKRRGNYISQNQVALIKQIFKEQTEKDVWKIKTFSEEDYKIYESKMSDVKKRVLVNWF